MPSTAAAMTSEWSSTSGSPVVTATGGAATLAARSFEGFLAGSATTAVKTCPLVTRWRASGRSVGVDPRAVPSFRPQVRQLTASNRFGVGQEGQGIEFGMDHLGTDDRYDLEAPLVEHEAAESRLVLRAPHLLDPDSALNLDVRDRVHLELNDSVCEVRLVPPRFRTPGCVVRRFRCGFGAHE